MGLFKNLMDTIFHGANAPAPVKTPLEVPKGPAAPVVPAPAKATAAAVMEQVDVTTILDGLAAKNKEKLDWRHSIVDLMKLVGMDSGLASRQELAKDLKYTGDINDSAAMNIWLHKEVMKKLAEHGGKLPQELIGH